eukprot:CAMPEP_0202351546 /NCGR_PEP_ID=MMETSP1126-20121109/8138_1 /ASSEMBLY_ACC=CAM_ASM_000457 /TAXON_ID=3047 /ORGANISM="Dunaliella tertiolecta, Strain CCMP1320" /LENGTH=75 /DNA_ID=CAMNT_0048943665 /DNA_START=301 /DNA_END=528 /DNA_ORIENTATION=+
MTTRAAKAAATEKGEMSSNSVARMDFSTPAMGLSCLPPLTATTGTSTPATAYPSAQLMLAIAASIMHTQLSITTR